MSPQKHLRSLLSTQTTVHCRSPLLLFPEPTIPPAWVPQVDICGHILKITTL